MPKPPQTGFTLVELMVTVAIIGIVAAVAVPSYTAYIRKAQVPPALDSLSATATRLEQFYQDRGNYGTSTCGSGMTMPTPDKNWAALTCTLSGDQQSFTLSAKGLTSSPMKGYEYSVNSAGTRKTVAHPANATPPATCWSIAGTTCDAS